MKNLYKRKSGVINTRRKGAAWEDYRKLTRLRRITALSIFFGVGAIISLTAALALLFPQSFLQSLWRINPRALEAFHRIGPWAILLLLIVSIGCATAAIGLWSGKLWGYRLAIALLVVNLLGDIYNVVSGTETRAAIGIPIVLLILFFVTTRETRTFFKR